MKYKKSQTGPAVVRKSRRVEEQRKASFYVEEIFYYLFFAILLFAKGIGLYDGMKEFTVCLLAAFLCFAVKVCLTEHTLGELIQMVVLLGIGFLSWQSSGEKAAFIYLAVIVGMKHVPVKRVLRLEPLYGRSPFSERSCWRLQNRSLIWLWFIPNWDWGILYDGAWDIRIQMCFIFPM